MEYFTHVLIIILIYAILGISLNLLMGYSGLMSLAHAAFFALGSYSLALLALNLGANFFAALIIGIIVSALLGIIVAVAGLRVKGEYFILLTLAFQMVIFGSLVSLKELTGGRTGLPGIPRPEIFGSHLANPVSYLPLIILLAALSFFVIWRITSSPFGRVLKAMREDEEVTISFGKDARRFKVLAFMVGGGVAAVAGASFASYTSYISPHYFTVDVAIFIVAIVALGGTANLWGSLVGAIVIISIPELLTFFGGEATIRIGNINVQRDRY